MMTEIRVDQTYDYICYPTATLIFSHIKIIEKTYYYHFLVKQHLEHHDECCGFDIRADHAARRSKFNGKMLRTTGFVQLKLARDCFNQTDPFADFIRTIQLCAKAALERHYQNPPQTDDHTPPKTL